MLFVARPSVWAGDAISSWDGAPTTVPFSETMAERVEPAGL